MAKSVHQFEIRGVDKSAGAFASIKSRAAATSAQIRSMVGGAIAFAGAYLGFSAIKGGIDQLGHLSDIAQKTSTSVDELTKAAAAMSAIGIQNMGVDQLGKAFDYLQKTTGRTGMAGFYQTIGELGKIEDVAKRGQEAMRIFGRSGMEFMPLINAAGDGTAALKTVTDAMPSISQAAANAANQSTAALQTVIDAMPSIPQAAANAANQSTAALKTVTDAMPSISQAAANAANQSTAALQTVIDAMPSIPQAAANAGDAMSDAMGFAANQVKSIWLQGLGAICGWFDNEYKGGVREASLAAGNYLEYYTRMAVAKCITWFGKLQSSLTTYGETLGAFIGAVGEKLFGTGGTWGDVFNVTKNAFSQGVLEAADDFAKLDEAEHERSERFKRDFEDRAIAISKFQDAYNNAAKSTRARSLASESVAAKTPTIRNDLVMGGSNAVTKMQILGPTLQSESKKQTKLLEKIATNTEKTADNTEDTAEEMGTVN